MKDHDIEASWATEPLFYEAPCPPGQEPRQYQHASVEYCLARDHALIGDAPGLGKTIELLMLSNAIEAKRILVVCPASLRLNWEREVWRWSMLPNVRTYPVLKAQDGVSPEANYLIISYDMLRNKNILQALLDLRWDHLILDEAHYLKDPKGNKRTAAICAEDGLRSVAGRITMASGTILPNQPIECYNAIRLLDWSAIDYMSVEGFRDYFYEKGQGFVTGRYETTLKNGETVMKYGPHWSDEVRNVPCNLDQLRTILRGDIMVRRLKEDVLKELPEKQWHVFPLAASKEVRKVMADDSWCKVEKLYELDTGAFDEGIPIDGAISTAFRLLGEATAPSIADYIEDLFDSGIEKLVVGAWHISVLDYLKERLTKYGVAYIDGNTSPKKKQAQVDLFQEDIDTRIILGQVLPLGEGWTLTAAQDVVQAEPWWVPGKNDQLLERTHRIGQEGDRVLGHMPFVPGTLHEKIISQAVAKDKNIYETLDVRD